MEGNIELNYALGNYAVNFDGKFSNRFKALLPTDSEL